MKKRLISLILTLCMTLSLLPTVALAASVTATPSATKLMVNGKPVTVDAYLINQNNYVKLRDLATIINGTEKNFEVSWDGAKNAINLISRTKYTPTNGDMGKGDGKSKTATPATSKIYIDGVETPLTAYVIGQNNYFKLRDVMAVFNVYVGWDQQSGTATLDTSKGYEAEKPPNPVTAKLTEKNIEGYHNANAFYHDYIRFRGDYAGIEAQRWSEPVTSHIVQTADGGFMRVDFDLRKVDDKWTVMVQNYDRDMKLLSQKTIPNELPIYGGFYAGKDNYFLFYGQENPKEDNSVETFRLVKYDKSWNRLGQTSFSATGTVEPFWCASVSMAENAGKLYIHTGHKMYADANGVQHQANITLVADIATMARSGMSNYDTMMALGKADGALISHCFNQYAAAADGIVVTAGHGDGTPRAMKISKRNLDDITRNNNFSNYLPLAGNFGENFTAAELGGLEISSSSILTVGCTADQSTFDSTKRNSNHRNIFVSASSRDNPSAGTTITYLTDYPKGAYSAGNPFLVKLSPDRFMMLWSEKPAVSDQRYGYKYEYNAFNAAPVLCYTYLDGKGAQIAPIVKTRGELSDCKPILTTEGSVVWTAPRERKLKLFSIKVDDLTAMKSITPGTGADTVVKNDWEPGWNTISAMGNYLHVSSAGTLELSSAGKTTPLLVTREDGTTITIQTPDLKYLAHEGLDPKAEAKIILSDKSFQWDLTRDENGGIVIRPWTNANMYLYFDGKSVDGSPALISPDINISSKKDLRCHFQFTTAAKPAAKPVAEDTTPGPLKDGQYVIALMDNFLSVNASGAAELQGAAKTTRYKLTGKGGNRYTIQTAGGQYLATDGGVKSGTKVVTSPNEFIWNLYSEKGNKYSLRSFEALTHVVNASGEQQKDGTPVILWDYQKSMDAPRHAEFSFISMDAATGGVATGLEQREAYVDTRGSFVGSYGIGGRSYFSLADVAMLLMNTGKKFNFTVDKEKNTLNITMGGTYIPTENETINQVDKERGIEQRAYISSLTVFLDGVKKEMMVYEIAGRYCFRIYELAEAMNISLGTGYNSISLDTTKPYSKK